MRTLAIVDYGMGNLRSVQKAFEKLGFAAEITNAADRLREARGIVLPGVGAFADAISRLREGGLAEPISEHVRSGKPFLGICLGLQLLFSTSSEDGCHRGLDLFGGEVVRFPDVPGLKVPHMGWNQMHIHRQAPELAGLPEHPDVYFVHSYYVVPRDRSVVAAETDYGGPFASAIWHENVFACQFHPEKSQRIGLQILKNFASRLA